VEHVADGRDLGLRRKAAEDVDGPTGDVVGLDGVVEQRTEVGLSEAATVLVLIETSLQRPQEEITFGPIGVDHPKPCIGGAVGLPPPRFPHAVDVDELAAENEEVARFDAGVLYESLCLAYARGKFTLGLIEERLEIGEILAGESVCNLIGQVGAFLNGLYVAQDSNIGCTRLFQFREQIVIFEGVDRSGSAGSTQKVVTVHREQKGKVFGWEFAQLVEAHRVDALKDVAVMAVTWRVAVGFVETENVFEAGDDTLLKGSVAAGLLVGEFYSELVK